MQDRQDRQEHRSNGPDHVADGLRLAKRVAAEADCSRREAELLITAGRVCVDGVVALLPQARVMPAQRVEVAAAVAADAQPQTVLLYKAAGVNCGTPLSQLLPATAEVSQAGAGRASGPVGVLRVVAALDTEASGLVVLSADPRVIRKLQEDAAVLEHELMVDVAGELDADAVAQLRQAVAARHPGGAAAVRISVSRQRDGLTGLRWAIKGLQPGQLAAWCAAQGLTLIGSRRLRLGRVALGGLQPGEWRRLPAFDRF